MNFVVSGKDIDLTFWVDGKTTCICLVHVCFGDMTIYTVNVVQTTGPDMLFVHFSDSIS